MYSFARTKPGASATVLSFVTRTKRFARWDPSPDRVCHRIRTLLGPLDPRAPRGALQPTIRRTWPSASPSMSCMAARKKHDAVESKWASIVRQSHGITSSAQAAAALTAVQRQEERTNLMADRLSAIERKLEQGPSISPSAAAPYYHPPGPSSGPPELRSREFRLDLHTLDFFDP